MNLLDLEAPWRTHAACLGANSDVFFIEGSRGRGGYKDAKAICQTCYVTADCLDYAIKHRLEEGVWGGMSPRERRRVRTRRRAG